VLRPTPESDLRCSSCRAVSKPLTGQLTLGIDVVDDIATVQAVDFFCSDACLSGYRPRWVQATVVLYPLADFDPYAHLDETIPKYAWARGTIERFARMLSALTPWQTSAAPSDSGVLFEPSPHVPSPDGSARGTEN
jgi:hypothetical protein